MTEKERKAKRKDNLDEEEVEQPRKKRFKFMRFAEKIASIELDVFRTADYRALARQDAPESAITAFAEELSRLSSSSLVDASERWAVLERRLRARTLSLPLLLKHQREVLRLLLEALEGPPSLQRGVHRLVLCLAKDLRQEFYAVSFGPVLRALVHSATKPLGLNALGGREDGHWLEAEHLESVFLTLATLFKHLLRSLQGALPLVLAQALPLLAAPRPYVRLFTAEALAYLLRHTPPAQLPEVLQGSLHLVEAAVARGELAHAQEEARREARRREEEEKEKKKEEKDSMELEEAEEEEEKEKNPEEREAVPDAMEIDQEEFGHLEEEGEEEGMELEQAPKEEEKMEKEEEEEQEEEKEEKEEEEQESVEEQASVPPSAQAALEHGLTQLLFHALKGLKKRFHSSLPLVLPPLLSAWAPSPLGARVLQRLCGDLARWGGPPAAPVLLPLLVRALPQHPALVYLVLARYVEAAPPAPAPALLLDALCAHSPLSAPQAWAELLVALCAQDAALLASPALPRTGALWAQLALLPAEQLPGLLRLVLPGRPLLRPLLLSLAAHWPRTLWGALAELLELTVPALPALCALREEQSPPWSTPELTPLVPALELPPPAPLPAPLQAALLEALLAPDAELQLLALRVLAWSAPALLLPYAHALVLNPALPLRLRTGALEVLAAVHAPLPALTPTLLAPFLTSAPALYALARFAPWPPPALEVLLPQLAAPSPWVRDAVVSLLRHLQPPQLPLPMLDLALSLVRAPLLATEARLVAAKLRRVQEELTWSPPTPPVARFALELALGSLHVAFRPLWGAAQELIAHVLGLPDEAGIWARLLPVLVELFEHPAQTEDLRPPERPLEGAYLHDLQLQLWGALRLAAPHVERRMRELMPSLLRLLAWATPQPPQPSPSSPPPLRALLDAALQFVAACQNPSVLPRSAELRVVLLAVLEGDPKLAASALLALGAWRGPLVAHMPALKALLLGGSPLTLLQALSDTERQPVLEVLLRVLQRRLGREPALFGALSDLRAPELTLLVERLLPPPHASLSALLRFVRQLPGLWEQLGALLPEAEVQRLVQVAVEGAQRPWPPAERKGARVLVRALFLALLPLLARRGPRVLPRRVAPALQVLLEQALSEDVAVVPVQLLSALLAQDEEEDEGIEKEEAFWPRPVCAQLVALALAPLHRPLPPSLREALYALLNVLLGEDELPGHPELLRPVLAPVLQGLRQQQLVPPTPATLLLLLRLVALVPRPPGALEPELRALVRALPPLLRGRVAPPLRAGLLELLQALLPLVPAPTDLLPLVAHLLLALPLRADQLALLGVVRALGEREVALQPLGVLLGRLAAWDAQQVDQPDYLVRQAAHQELLLLLQPPHALPSAWLPPVLALLLNALGGEDLSLRTQAAQCLHAAVVPLRQGHWGAPELVGRLLVPALKRLLGSAHEGPRQEALRLVGGVEPGLAPIASELQDLAHPHEAKRVRALERLALSLRAGALSPSVLHALLLPVLWALLVHAPSTQHAQAQAAALALQATLRVLPWGPGAKLLSRLLGVLGGELPLAQEKRLLTALGVLVGGLDRHLARPDGKARAWLQGRLLSALDAWQRSRQSEAARVLLLVETQVRVLAVMGPNPSTLHRLLHVLGTLLASRVQLVRNTARQTLIRSLQTLGAAALAPALAELQSSLRRGYQLHVLGYTLHLLLVQCHALFTQLSTDALLSLLPTLVRLLQHDYLGLSEQKEADALLKGMKEGGKSRAPASFELLAATLPQLGLDALVQALTAPLLRTHDPKHLHKLTTLFHHLVAGAVRNPRLSPAELLPWCQAVLQRALPREQPALPTPQSAPLRVQVSAVEVPQIVRRDRGRLGRDEAEDAPQRIDALTRAQRHRKERLQELDVQRGLEERREEDEEDEEEAEQPLPPPSTATHHHVLVAFALDLAHALLRRTPQALPASARSEWVRELTPLVASFHFEVAQSALRVLGVLLPLSPEPALLRPLAKAALARLLATPPPELLASCVRVLVALLKTPPGRLCFSQGKQSRLLQWAALALAADTTPLQLSLALTLLRALVHARLLHLYDLAWRATELIVAAPTAPLRSAASALVLAFLLACPLTKRRLDAHLDRLRAGLTYAHAEGRLSALATLKELLTRFPAQFLQERAASLWAPLCLVLGQDEDAACRAAAQHALSTLVRALSPEARAPLLTLTRTWLGGDEARAVLGAQVAAVWLAEAEGASLGPELLAWVAPSCPWRRLYHALCAFTHAHTAPHAPALYRALLPTLAPLLDHEHAWVRAATGRVLGHALALVPHALDTPGAGWTLGLALCRQLELPQDAPAGEQTVKNLVYVARHFYARPELTPPPEGALTPLDWLLRRLSYMGRRALVTAPLRVKLVLQALGVLVGKLLPLEAVPPLLPPIFHLLLRLEGLDAPPDAQVRANIALAHELVELFRTRLAPQVFVHAYEQVRLSLGQRRLKRRRDDKAEALLDPEAHARKRMRHHERKKVVRKRRNAQQAALRSRNPLRVKGQRFDEAPPDVND